MTRNVRINIDVAPGLTALEWAVMPFSGKNAIKTALKHGWRVEKAGRTFKFHHPYDPENYRLTGFAGLEFLGKKDEWRP